MRKVIDEMQHPSGSVSIEEAELGPKSRNDIPVLLTGLQVIYSDKGRGPRCSVFSSESSWYPIMFAEPSSVYAARVAERDVVRGGLLDQLRRSGHREAHDPADTLRVWSLL